MGTDWDEIKRLAADFQKAQLTSTLQKLSERNCIEIVTLLLEKQQLEVVFTNDGKEYVTPAHLEREIQDELYVNGGRVNLVEVSKTLNVDLSRIEEASARIASENPQIHYTLGQLIDEDYITNIAQEINEKLAQKGEISISDLTQQFDLPTEFLQHNVVEKHLGKLIRGRQDPTNPRILFTQAYIQRCRAKIRGALAAITRPINVATILQQINVQEKIFHTLFDEIAPAGQITSKQANALYVPHIYAKIQSDWVNSCYKQNGVLEYEAISKLGISDPKQYIRKQFPNEEIIFLKHCAIPNKFIELTVLSALNECSATKSYVDLTTLFPFNLSEEDIEEVFELLMTLKGNNFANSFVFLEGIVFTQQYLEDLLHPCNELAFNMAKVAIDSGVYQHFMAEKQLASKHASAGNDFDNDDKLDRRDERRKKASSGKAGGGSQGRETKTKSTKKHQRGRNAAARNESSDEENTASTKKSTSKSLELVKRKDVSNIIFKPLETEGLEHLVETIVELHIIQLNQLALAKAQELFEATPQTNRRQTHAATQEKMNTHLIDIRLYEKGLKLFPANVQSQLGKYLLKSLGNDICNELTIYIASECNLNLKETNLNVDQRQKIALDCTSEYRNPLIELNKSLNKSIDEFVLATETVLKACSMVIRKIDKKKDRQFISTHRQMLASQLQDCTDAALVLHLTALFLFTVITGCILHASGKFVSNILSFLKPNLSTEDNALLMRYYDLVLKLLQTDAESAEAKLFNEELLTLQDKVKQMVLTYKNPSVSKAD